MNCPTCGATVPSGARFCGVCGGALTSTSDSYPGMVAGPVVQYGGFWIRFVAVLIDGIVLGVAQGIVQALTGNDQAITSLFGLVSGFLYYSLLHSSEWQATLGKKALGLKVTDLEGRRITFGKAAARYFASLLSAIILLIGYIMAAFDDRKRTLHDRLVGTYVVKAG